MDLDRDAEGSCALAPAALESRQAALLSELAPGVVELEETADGYRFWFEASVDRLRQLAEFIAFEKDCCAFLDFAVEWRGRERRLSLTVGGPGGAKAAARKLFVAPLERRRGTPAGR